MITYKTGLCPLGSTCEKVEGTTIVVCPWYTKMQGTNPQTGETMDESKCAIAWLPILLCENSRQQHSTGAAIESFRNEMVNKNTDTLQLLLSGIQRDS